jgi:phosphoglycolate phosphatase
MTGLAVFDFDGTLVDSQHAIQACMEATFAAEGLRPPTLHQTHRIIGLPLDVCLARLAPESDAATHARLVEGYKTAFHALRRQEGWVEPLYDGALDALAALEAAGWTLGIATGKNRRGLEAVLEAHGLHPRFATLQTSDRAPGKPDPTMLHWAMAETGFGPAETVMIGDTVFDMAMARAAKVRGLGVAWGYHDEAELIEHGAERVLARFSDLAPALAIPRGEAR